MTVLVNYDEVTSGQDAYLATLRKLVRALCGTLCCGAYVCTAALVWAMLMSLLAALFLSELGKR